MHYINANDEPPLKGNELEYGLYLECDFINLPKKKILSLITSQNINELYAATCILLDNNYYLFSIVLI